MPSDDVGGPLTAAGSEFYDHAAVADGNTLRLQRFMTRIHEGLVIVAFRWMRLRRQQAQGLHLFNRDADRQCTVNFHVLDFCNLPVFFDGP